MSQALHVAALGTARRYKIARETAGLKQAELAAALGVAQTTLSDWETGKTEPAFSRMVRLAQVTGQPLEWFAEGIEVDECARRDSNSQPSDLEPDTFWTPHRASIWRSICRQDTPDTEIAHLIGVR